MRAALLVFALAGHAAADPKTLPNSAIPEGTPPVQEKLPDVATKAPAIGGGSVRGLVVTPPVHPDAAPWPRGMVIHPPDTRDPMALAIGDPHLGQRVLGIVNDGFEVLGKLLRPPI